jgi:peptidoglycan/xylan/chitin deacetylase (PgdA/CDA1 family)
MGGKFARGKAGTRLAKICIGACYYFLIVKPGDILARILGRPRHRLVVLCYHGVGSGDRSAFAWQMDALKRAARPTALSRLYTAPGNGNLVAVTFDDGFASIRQNALPELEARSIPATIFVPTGNLGNQPMWTMEKDEPYPGGKILDADELRILAGPIVGFGSHSVSHADLTIMTEEQILGELSRSKRELEGILGTPVDLFAVPYGRYCDRVSGLAKRAGYRKVFTMDPDTMRPDDPRILVGRIRVDPYDWKIEFWLKIRGAYKGVVPFYRLKRKMNTASKETPPQKTKK